LGVPEPQAAAKDDWTAHLEREEARYRDGEARLADPNASEADDPRQRQLTRLGNAAGGAGLRC
jgi:hypothetical protein